MNNLFHDFGRQIALLLASLLLHSGLLAADFATLKQKLTELEELRKIGALTEAEYNELKAKWLKELAPPGGGSDVEEKPKVTFYCAYDGRAITGLEADNYLSKSYSESATISEAVKEILDAVNLAPNFVIQASARVKDNAVALQQGPYRYILYDPQFFEKVKSATGRNWSLYSILAHELGHHLNGHSLLPGGSRPDLELQADEYSGAVMAQLGASLEDAQAAMRLISGESDSATHPGKARRLGAIKKGFDKAAKGGSPNPKKPKAAEVEESEAQPTGKKPCVHRIPCQHFQPGSCVHQIMCVHQAPCTHQTPCAHTSNCTHIVPCQHPVLTPFGVQPAHAGDQLHAYDQLHPYDLLHSADAAHPFDVRHPNGDPLHDEDVQHPEGD